jgi:hypothetical protein
MPKQQGDGYNRKWQKPERGREDLPSLFLLAGKSKGQAKCTAMAFRLALPLTVFPFRPMLPLPLIPNFHV